MTFAATSFAENAFCADDSTPFDVVGTFPILPFNGETLTFVCHINTEAGFELPMTQVFERSVTFNTGVDIVGLINTQADHSLLINTVQEYKLVR